jgi:hypothetical protein
MKLGYDYEEIPYLVTGSSGTGIVYKYLPLVYEPNIFTKIVGGVAFAIGLYIATQSAFEIFRSLGSRIFVERDQKKELLSNMDKYPLEFVRMIEFKDIDRNVILDETLKTHLTEWMIFHKCHAEDEVAIIDEVVPPKEALKKGLYRTAGVSTLIKNVKKTKNYDGDIHCHHFKLLNTIFPGHNYAIPRIDRLGNLNKIRFTTFVEGKTPKIVGYNYCNVYVPKNDFSYDQHLILEQVTDQEIRELLSAGKI